MANIRINGIGDEAKGETVEDKVLTVINDNMGFHPPIQSVGRSGNMSSTRASGKGRPRTVIVRFNIEQVYRSRGMLKGYNATNDPDKIIDLNEDLTTKVRKVSTI